MAKKEPLRKCVGCGEMKSKKELVRIIHTSDGAFLLDESGRANGRGAYICRNKMCLQTAQKRKGFERSFKAPIPPEVYSRLEEEYQNLG